MKSQAAIGQDGVVKVSVSFVKGEREFGKWRWNIQWMLARDRETMQIFFGVYEVSQRRFLVEWKPSEAVPVIRALLDKGKYKAITHMPYEETSGGYVGIMPNPKVETAVLDSASIQSLQQALSLILDT